MSSLVERVEKKEGRRIEEKKRKRKEGKGGSQRVEGMGKTKGEEEREWRKLERREGREEGPKGKRRGELFSNHPSSHPFPLLSHI